MSEGNKCFREPGILRKTTICFICLKPGHISKFCSGYKCNKCLKRLHIALCDSENKETRDITVTERSPDETKRLLTVNRNHVLLQTAVCQVSRVGDPKYALSRLLLDSGSQRS